MKEIALVTGGTRGIGAAISQALKNAGYQVAATYVGHEEIAQDFRKRTGIEVFKWDVGDFEACRQGVATVKEKLGPVDVLVNNAGITRDGMFHKSNPKDWEEVIRTNLISCFTMSYAVIQDMREKNYGRIINISSINGQKGQVGQVNYSAAKAGVIGFTKALAQECAKKGITVNAIAPGYIVTDMVKSVPEDALNQIISQIPVGRLGEPEEIARCVVFLADKGASFITGSTLTINGGHYFI